MPLSKPMVELLALIKDENERKVVEEQFLKHEFLQERFAGNLRQEDYDRFMNESKKQIADAEKKAKAWEDWAAVNKPRHETLLAEYKTTKEQNDGLQKQLKEATDKLALAGTGEEMTEEQFQKIEARVRGRVAELGYVSKTDLQTIVAQEVASAKKEMETVANTVATKIRDEERKSFNEQTMPSTLRWFQKNVDMQFKHRDEFGSPMDTTAFAKFIVENKLEDLDKAYEMFTAEPRAKKKEAELRAQIEKDVRSQLSMPGSGAPPTPERGAVEMMRQRAADKEPLIPVGATAGDGSLAAAAAAELRQEGKF